MKVTPQRTIARDIHPKQQPDLSQKPIFPKKPSCRKTKFSGAGFRLKRNSGTPSANWGSRPETPLIKWKFGDGDDKNKSVEEEKSVGEGARKSGRNVSSRKLGASLWRFQSPEFQNGGGQTSGGRHVGASIHGHHVDRVHNSPAKDLIHSPHSVSAARNGIMYKFEPSFQYSNSAMEGATKWDPVCWKTSNDSKQIFGQPKLIDQRDNVAPLISALKMELDQAKTRINDLESERKSSKKKIEQFLRKLSEERLEWRSREHEKIRAILDDMKLDLNREKKNRQRLEIVNSKLVNELADTKLSAKRYVQEYGKERKARELIEEVCDELAKEIGEDKAEVETLKRESMQLQEEVEEERKMLQMAEVWREERVQMKLIDAKIMLEEKYVYLNRLVKEIESFLSSSGKTSDMEELKKAEFLRQMGSSVNIQDIRDLTYEPPNPDDIFSVFEDVNFNGSNEKDVEQCGEYSPASYDSKIHTVSPEIKMINKNSKNGYSDMFMDHSGELEEDRSEWETVSHPDDQGSSFSPDGGEEMPIVEISEVGSGQTQNLKKGSSISRLWKSNNGDDFKDFDGINGRLLNGRISNGSRKSGFRPQDFVGEWTSSPDFKGGEKLKGCIEWPRSVQKNSLKSRLSDARMDSQKIQLRQVLKQKF